jgi:hypothetical protein
VYNILKTDCDKFDASHGVPDKLTSIHSA